MLCNFVSLSRSRQPCITWFHARDRACCSKKEAGVTNRLHFCPTSQLRSCGDRPSVTVPFSMSLLHLQTEGRAQGRAFTAFATDPGDI